MLQVAASKNTLCRLTYSRQMSICKELRLFFPFKLAKGAVTFSGTPLCAIILLSICCPVKVTKHRRGKEKRLYGWGGRRSVYMGGKEGEAPTRVGRKGTPLQGGEGRAPARGRPYKDTTRFARSVSRDALTRGR